MNSAAKAPAAQLPPVKTGPAAFLEQVYAIVAVEVRKVSRDPVELFSRVAQPVLWLAVFGQVFSRVRGIPTGGLDYMAFMAPACWRRACSSAPSSTASALSGSATSA